MAEEALKESSEKIKFFAYSISHDIKSPTIGIHGLTKKLCETYSNVFDERGKKYCDQILKASSQIVELVSNINLYISAGEANLKIEDIQLKEITQTVIEEFSTQFDFRRIRWSEPRQMPVIRADRSAILRVLRNLVDNALKYGSRDLSEIRFNYQDRGGFHTISLSDDGIGIRREDCKRIFEPFYRNADSGGVQGTGLGLAIIKEIAKQHRGEVWAEHNPSRGITFHMTIPKSIP
jgi:signal transduction histidine kinase